MIQSYKMCFQIAKRLVLLLLLTGIINATYANNSHYNHYSKATITTSNALGKVYVSANTTAPTNTNWQNATATANQNCEGNENNDSHTYYFYAQNQSNWLWAGWEKDNVFISNSQNGTLTNGYYRTSQSVQAESTDGGAPTEVNMKALWWRPQITNTEIVEVTTNPKYEETITVCCTCQSSDTVSSQITVCHVGGRVSSV